MPTPSLPIPPTEPTPMEAAMETQFVAQLQRDGIPALYRKGGTGPPQAVTIILSGSPAETRELPGGGGFGRPQSTSRRMALLCKALGVGELLNDDADAGGVGERGGVRVLNSNDTFEVHGLRAGHPEVATTRVSVVAGTVRQNGPEWFCEVAG